MVALGLEIAGLFTPSDKVAEAVSSAAKATGEKVWRMPMENNYWDAMKRWVAKGDEGGEGVDSLEAWRVWRRCIWQAVQGMMGNVCTGPESPLVPGCCEKGSPSSWTAVSIAGRDCICAHAT